MLTSTLHEEHLRASSLSRNSTNNAKTNQDKQTILVIEDNAECMSLLEFLLKPFFYKTVTTITAEEALEYLAKNSNDVVLIITDIDLPGISGIELISKIKEKSNLKQIPIIIQSGERDDIIQKGMSLGADGYVQKPYNKEDLYNEIQKSIKLTPKKNY